MNRRNINTVKGEIELRYVLIEALRLEIAALNAELAGDVGALDTPDWLSGAEPHLSGTAVTPTPLWDV